MAVCVYSFLWKLQFHSPLVLMLSAKRSIKINGLVFVFGCINAMAKSIRIQATRVIRLCGGGSCRAGGARVYRSTTTGGWQPLRHLACTVYSSVEPVILMGRLIENMISFLKYFQPLNYFKCPCNSFKLTPTYDLIFFYRSYGKNSPQTFKRMKIIFIFNEKTW